MPRLTLRPNPHTTVHFEDDGRNYRMHQETVIPRALLDKIHAIATSANRRTTAIGHDDMMPVAEVPAALWYEHVIRPSHGDPDLRQKLAKRFLENPDNKLFRTDGGTRRL